eukprot:TRINITY_DN11054_c0_g1_i1.p1 TRINITY_DN11054_c0_g1~~TRINITY_DN11054_c0_g1_i1.p1  ORF type:complete len:529 (+),score=51.89 TRINITY_DN11054_c0_g1_i1:44-1630(+)
MKDCLLCFFILSFVVFACSQTTAPDVCNLRYCNTTTICASGTCCNGICVPTPTLGNPCACGQCSGSTCVNGMCSIISAGCNCTTNGDCSSQQAQKLVCVSGTCLAAGLRKRQPCTSTVQCYMGLQCVQEMCHGTLSLNQTCTTNPDMCDSETYCPYVYPGTSKCAPFLQTNATCTSDSQCDPSLTCRSRTCQEFSLPGEPCTYSSNCLNSDNICNLGICTVLNSLDENEHCSTDAACQSAQCGCNTGLIPCVNNICLRPTLPLGAACDFTWNNCYGTCQCTQWNANNACNRATCIDAYQANIGDTCSSNAECKSTQCNLATRTCVQPYSGNVGSNCRSNLDCLPTARCDSRSGMCASYDGNLCYGTFDCGPGQSCVCDQQASLSYCRSNSTLINTLSRDVSTRQTCALPLWHYRTVDCNDPSTNWNGNLSIECSNLTLDYYCCLGCSGFSDSVVNRQNFVQSIQRKIDCGQRTFLDDYTPPSCCGSSDPLCGVDFSKVFLGCDVYLETSHANFLSPLFMCILGLLCVL